MTPAIAWQTRDDKYLLDMHFLVVGRYFVMGSTFEDQDEPTTWLTRSFHDEVAAHSFALMCTENVEKNGDVLTEGPTAYEIPDPSAELEELVNDDIPSSLLDVMFGTVLLYGDILP